MSASKQRVLVTGGAGFIGANLCHLLCRAGADVIVVDDLSTGSLDNLNGANVEFLHGTVLDQTMLIGAFKHVDSVVHLAARPSVPRSLDDPMATHESNVTGTMRVLEAARATNLHLILASSSSVYGGRPTLPTSETALPSPVSPYAASKLAAEAYALAYLRSFSVPVLLLRFFNVYGPLQPADHAYAAVVPRFIEAAVLGQPLEVYGDGRQTRDFTFVDTVSDVLARAVARRVIHDGPVNLAFGSRTSLLELIAAIERLVGRAVDVRHAKPRRGDVPHSQADNSLLRGLFPDIVPTRLDTGLAKTLAWFRATLDQQRATVPVPTE